MVDTWSSIGTQYLPTDGILTVTATDPLGNQRVVVSRTSNGHVISDTAFIDGLARTTSYQYIADDQGRPGAGKIQQVTSAGRRPPLVRDGRQSERYGWLAHPQGSADGR